MKLTRTVLPSLRLLICALALSACASPPATSRTDLVGTWRWVAVDGHRVDQPFYARYYPDGKAATWPAPKGWSDSKGVSRGRYSIANGYFVIDTSSGQHGPKARIQLRKDEFILIGDEGNRLRYRRVLPTLEPGRLENGTAGGYLKNPM